MQKSKKRFFEITDYKPIQKSKKGCFETINLLPPKQKLHAIEEVEKAFNDAVKKHPFHDNADHIIDFHTASVFRDAKGKVCGVLLPDALPAFAANMASDVLRPAATKTSLRSNMFGGQAPLSGIAGYFDYRGSPVELKCRKTSFTHEHVNSWYNVFPMIDYVSAIYKATFPLEWAAQNAAIPDIVRIHGSPFSTLTINQRFRTASHTDAGDFDNGYGLLAVLEGNFKGLSLALDDFGVCFCMQPRDILIFNTHFFHSNTELELNNPKSDWDRLTCVFYYRAALGGPSCITEYKRRLKYAKEMKALPPPVVNNIVEKVNGDNFNKPAPTFPILLTPFGGAAGVCSMQSCQSKLLHLHNLIIENSELEIILFGEPLRIDDGIPCRRKEELIPVHLPVVIKVPSTGGFSETNNIIKEAEEKQYFFEEKNLERELGSDLISIWNKSREIWLKLVKEEWERLLKKNPERVNFNWNNSSSMNSAFFDLCEVAKQVMLGVLNKENATKSEEHSFWALYAAHLNFSCFKEIGMPRDAISMRKLNVKLKDFHFGGTRYLKDMPPDEQQRRLERKQQIEEARRRGSVLRETHSSNWLYNDTFDYQHENKQINFSENGWLTPEENVQRIGITPCENSSLETNYLESINILIVLPRPTSSTSYTPINLPTNTSQESDRLLKNPAAQRLLSNIYLNKTIKSSINIKGVTITFTFDRDENENKNIQADFVILHHILSTIENDTEAKLCVNFWSSQARYGVFILETDVMDRRHYLLREEIRIEYESVAQDCFCKLHAAAFSAKSFYLRNTTSLIALTKNKNIEMRYKFTGSPLNTVALLVRGNN